MQRRGRPGNEKPQSEPEYGASPEGFFPQAITPEQRAERAGGGKSRESASLSAAGPARYSGGACLCAKSGRASVNMGGTASLRPMGMKAILFLEGESR